MANSLYGSGLNLDAMVVPVKAATVYTAQENSLYLPGAIVPKIEVPAGTKVPSNCQFESKKKGFQRYYVPEVLTLKEQLDETEVAIEERCRDAL